MQTVKIGKKFPWKTMFLGILCLILLFALVGFALPSVGVWMMSVVTAISLTLVEGAIICLTSMTFWAGIGIVGTLWFIAFYRKNYAKRRVLVPTTMATTLQAAPLQAGTFQQPPTVAQLVQDKDTEVTSA